MKSALFILTSLLFSLDSNAADPFSNFKLPEMENKLSAYKAASGELKTQFGVIEKNVGKCNFLASGIIKSRLVNPSKEGLSKQEQNVNKTHNTLKGELANIQKGFAANGTTALKGGPTVFEKGLILPLKGAVSKAKNSIANERKALLESEKLVQESDAKIKSALTGKSEACKNSYGAYVKAREAGKSLTKRLAELEASYQGQVDVAQAQLDEMFTALASK
jgi:hypothetical protein